MSKVIRRSPIQGRVLPRREWVTLICCDCGQRKWRVFERDELRHAPDCGKPPHDQTRPMGIRSTGGSLRLDPNSPKAVWIDTIVYKRR